MKGDNVTCQEEKIVFLRWQLEYVIDQIKMADNKINFLLAVYLVLLGTAISQTGKVISIFHNPSVCSVWKVVIGIICLLFMCCIFKFFCYFTNTVKPRTNPKDILKRENYVSLIFWKDVANMKFEFFKTAGLDERYNDLECQVYINSSIAKAKFESVNSAYKFLIPTLVILLLLFCLTYLMGT